MKQSHYFGLHTEKSKKGCSSSSLSAPISVMLGAAVAATTTSLTTVVMATVLTSRAGGTSAGRWRKREGRRVREYS